MNAGAEVAGVAPPTDAVVAEDRVPVLTPIAEAFEVGKTGLIGALLDDGEEGDADEDEEEEPIEVDLIGSAGLEARGVPCDVNGSFGPEEATPRLLCCSCCWHWRSARVD